jgi:hypothetical protein
VSQHSYRILQSPSIDSDMREGAPGPIGSNGDLMSPFFSSLEGEVDE